MDVLRKYPTELASLVANNYKAELRKDRNRAIRKRARDLLDHPLLPYYIEKLFTFGESKPGVPFLDYRMIWASYKFLLSPDGSCKCTWNLIKDLENSMANDGRI